MTKEVGLAAGIGFAVGAVLGSTVLNPRKLGFEKSPEELTEGLELDPDEIEPEDLDDVLNHDIETPMPPVNSIASTR